LPKNHFLSLILETLKNDKAENTVAIDLNGKTNIADYMVITSGSSRRKIIAMAEHLQKTIKSTGIKKISVEGGAECDWVLLDAGDIIIHLFRPEIRDFYKLEKIWMTPQSKIVEGSNHQ